MLPMILWPPTQPLSHPRPRKKIQPGWVGYCQLGCTGPQPFWHGIIIGLGGRDQPSHNGRHDVQDGDLLWKGGDRHNPDDFVDNGESNRRGLGLLLGRGIEKRLDGRKHAPVKLIGIILLPTLPGEVKQDMIKQTSRRRVPGDGSPDVVGSNGLER